MDRKDKQNPQVQTARILVEFLEVAITSVILLKGVYPNGAFERRRYLNVVVHKARHPELRDYIHSSVTGLLPFIQKGQVERVAVIFFDSNNVPIERFVFKIDVNQSYGSRVEEADLEFSLRSFFIKLPLSQSLTQTLPQDVGDFYQRSSHKGVPFHFASKIWIYPVIKLSSLIDCRWEITAYFRSLPHTSTSKDAGIWVPTDTKQWQQPPLITPIKSMRIEPLGVQLYLEHPTLYEQNT